MTAPSTRDPNTDTDLCSRCKRTIRLKMLRLEKGKHVCDGVMTASCKPVVEEAKK